MLKIAAGIILAVIVLFIGYAILRAIILSIIMVVGWLYGRAEWKREKIGIEKAWDAAQKWEASRKLAGQS